MTPGYASDSIFYMLWPSVFAAMVVAFTGLFFGAKLAAFPSVPLVRLVDWWISRVASPVLATESTVRRAATIFLNNAGVLTVVLACGVLDWLALTMVLLLGINLGTGFRLLAERTVERPTEESPARPPGNRLWFGILLNMLEPPAILLTLALAIAWPTVPLEATDVWQMYALWALPLLLLAAIGESLWTGVIEVAIEPRRREPGPDRGDGDQPPAAR